MEIPVAEREKPSKADALVMEGPSYQYLSLQYQQMFVFSSERDRERDGERKRERERERERRWERETETEREIDSKLIRHTTHFFIWAMKTVAERREKEEGGTERLRETKGFTERERGKETQRWEDR